MAGWDLDVGGDNTLAQDSWRRVMAFFSRRTADALLFRKLSFYGDGRVQEVLAEDASANQGLQKDWFQS